MNSPAPPPFLQNCFVIFDLGLCGDESGVEEDEILFFHPPGITYNTKIHFIGWCAAMMNFSKSFTTQALEVASLDKFKVAFKLVADDSIAMILTGTADQPDSTLIHHLDLLYSGFRFYNRSFQAVAESHPARKDLHQKMYEIGRELVPLLVHSFPSNVLRSFNPLPYAPLVHKANRHFIQASQLLHFVEAEPGNLSGCVIYKNSVICTHLDFMTTRFVLNRLDFNKSSLYATMQPLYSSTGRGRMEPVCDFIPVYMLQESVEKLIQDRDNMFPFSDIQTVTTPTLTSSPYPRQILTHHAAEEEEEKKDEFTSLGLCIVSVHELSIAILMTYKAFSNKQHIKRSIWKIPADPHFQTLENDLEQDNFTFLRATPLSLSGATLPPNGPIMNSPNNNSNNNNPPCSASVDMPNSSPSPRPSFLQPPLLFNARIVQSSSYNFFTYDPLTESAAITPLTTQQEYEFAQAISFMHHTFAEEPSVTEIIRKDSTGEIFGKQVFGREVYYQLKNGANISHDKFLEVIEKTVRTTLKEDHNINMI